MTSKLIFGYWNIRGLGQPIRYLLKYVNAEYTEKTYHFGPAPDYSRSEWLDEKFNLGFDFPNLPYIIHNGIKLTQSKAVLRYLGREYRLDGRDQAEQARIDQAEQQTVDIRNALRQVCFFEPESLDATLANQKPFLEQFDKFLYKDNGWILPDRVSYADFFLFETLDMLLDLKPTGLDQLSNLKSYHQRFASLPTMVAIRSSKQFKQMPYFWGVAKKFGQPHLPL